MATDIDNNSKKEGSGEHAAIELESQEPIRRKEETQEPRMVDEEQEPTSRGGEEEPVSVKNSSLSGMRSIAPGASFVSHRVSKNTLRVILIVCQTIILGVGVGYITWWPGNINIFATERDNLETLGNTHDEEMLLQRWQGSYLALSLVFTYYGCWAEDRGWLMLSMFMNIGIMSLFPFRNFESEMPYTLVVTIFAVISVYICYMLSERVQDSYLQDSQVGPSYFKKQCLIFDLPDLSVYRMGICQAVTAIGLIFLGLLWMLLEEAMITQPVRYNFSCNSWPGGRCGRYYGLQAQEFYVSRLAICMVTAGVVGVLGGLFRHRTLLILAVALTTFPFFGTLENSIYTMGASEDVRFMCSDDDWTTNERVSVFWGDEWDCTTQESYHITSIVFMILCSSFSLLHLWMCFRFSEKLQSWEEAKQHDVDVNLGDSFTCMFIRCTSPMRLYTYALLFLSIVVTAGGIVQIYFGAVSEGSSEAELNWKYEEVVLLDAPSYIDTPYIYGIFAILSGFCTLIFVFTDHRSILCLVFCLLVETNAIGFRNCIWHEIDLEYGIMQFAAGEFLIYPVYVNGHARNLLFASVQVYWVFLSANMIMVFFAIMAHEAIQDSEKMMNNNQGGLGGPVPRTLDM